MTTPVFNLEKSMQAVLYVAERLDRKDFHKIFKILYFADREHLSEYGRSITGDTYIAMPDGPVPSTIYDIFKIVRGDANNFFVRDIRSDINFKDLFEVTDRCVLIPMRLADRSVLSESDTDIIDAIITEYGNMTWAEIRVIPKDKLSAHISDNETVFKGSLCPDDLARILIMVSNSKVFSSAEKSAYFK